MVRVLIPRRQSASKSKLSLSCPFRIADPLALLVPGYSQVEFDLPRSEGSPSHEVEGPALHDEDSAPTVLAVDRFGTDQSVLLLANSDTVLHIEAYRGLDTIELAGRVIDAGSSTPTAAGCPSASPSTRSAWAQASSAASRNSTSPWQASTWDGPPASAGSSPTSAPRATGASTNSSSRRPSPYPMTPNSRVS